MGTCPKTTIFPVHLFFGFSIRASKTRAGPNVINIKRSEGGYLVTFKNDKKLYTKSLCSDHFAASPYKLPDLKIIKRTIAPIPSIKRVFFLFPELKSAVYKLPQ